MSRIVLKSFTSGSSHTSYLSRVTMTGIRSCRSATRAFGPIVKIVQLSMISPSGLLHSSHSPANAKDFTLTNLEAVRLLHRSHFSPLVKSIRRNEATFGKDRISKCRCGCHGLRPRVERPISDAHVLCPRWNQSPTHRCEVANLFALFFADGQDRLRWRNVVSRMRFNFIIRRLKPFSKVLLRVRQSVSVTHTFILTDSQFPSNFRPIQGQDKQR